MMNTPLHMTWQNAWRSVSAIARKDLLHFYRYPLNALMRIVEPIVWLLPLYFLGRAFGATSGDSGFSSYTGSSDFMSFILVGTAISSYVSAVFWGMGFALKKDMDSGVLESNWMTPTPRLVLLLGQTLANMLITTFNVIGMLLLASLIFGLHLSGSLLAVLPILLLMLVGLYGLGFAFAALVLLLRDASTLIDISNFAVNLLSGTQFPVTVLPRLLLPLALALPMTYGIDAIRGVLLGTYTLLPLPIEIAILLGFVVVSTVVGALIFRRVEYYCRVRGTLGQH